MSTQDDALRAAGAQLRALREARGMSQEDLSLDADVDQSTLSKMERLGPQAVSWSKLIKVADVLGCVIEISFRSRP